MVVAAVHERGSCRGQGSYKCEVSTISKVFLGLGCNKVTSTKSRLTGYDNQKIQVVGHAKLSVTVPSGKSAVVKFYVADNDNQTLLGMPAIAALELLATRSVNQVSEKPKMLTKQKLVDSHPDVFKGLGKFGDIVALELKSTAAPKAIPARLVPLKKRQRLQVEL